MTSKLSFRARALDASKPMAIYDREELPELAAINRAVPALPTGMEKEEESEKHLQDILKSSANVTSDLVIPTPEVFQTDMDAIYNELYKGEFKVGRQYIHVQPFANDHDLPDYDMDSEDEMFFNDVLKKKFDEVTELQFEDMIDRLEKNSGVQIVSSRDAKLLLSQDDDLIYSVYDYWVDKRLRLKIPLMPAIKSAELMCTTSGGSSNSSGNAGSSTNQTSSSSGPPQSSNHNNPYICFRRRTEKMQTRKNRKNDESSYEKMLKLRRDLNRAVTLLEMVRRREKIKKQCLEFGSDIFEKRVQAGDYDGKLFGEIIAGHRATAGIRNILQPTTNHHNPFQATNENSWNPLAASSSSSLIDSADSLSNASSSNNKKRPYRKKKSKFTVSRLNSTSSTTGYLPSSLGTSKSNGPEFGTSVTSDDDASETEEDEMEGPFAFKRKRGCKYYAPTEPSSYLWPWEHEAKYRFSLCSLSTPKPRLLGLSRRRIGRGGRMIIDRAYSDFFDEEDRGFWSDNSNPSDFIESGVHFRPVTPPHCREEEWDPYKSKLSDIASIPLKPLPLVTAMAASREGNPNPLLSTAAVAASLRQKTTTMGLKTVAVDQMSALNAAGALVSNNVIEMFDNKN
ncbi:enhancer of polycomb homolog 1 [Lepeophtheirus salmonis]|uniref:enhancer of polycomb homolog 1 n=1 Tax=Lepeophtheirus salmonis TaxID=72036 RepID=UPI001AEAE70B|nr:enhancer of polycomb homolog 1-like [Lepeophtheirus salmonis]